MRSRVQEGPDDKTRSIVLVSNGVGSLSKVVVTNRGRNTVRIRTETLECLITTIFLIDSVYSKFSQMNSFVVKHLVSRGLVFTDPPR